MELIGKMYHLRNGYAVCKARCYDGYTMQYFWTVWHKGLLVRSCVKSYEDAYAFAKAR